MKLENIADYKDFGKQSVTSLKKLVCLLCGENMKNAIDPITNKKSSFLWYCPCSPNRIEKIINK